MSAAIVPFPDRARRQVDEALAEREVLRKTRCIVRECWSIRAESAAIRRRYEARQRSIERLLAGLPDRA
jgi:hypothetical protein